MQVFDPRIAELAKLHDTRLALSIGDHAGRDFVLLDEERIGRLDGGCLVLPDGLTALDGSDDHIYAATNLGITSTTSFMISVGVTIPDTSQKGAFVKIGSSSDGFGLGVGGTSFENTGNYVVGLLEGVVWKDTTSAIGTGFHTVSVLYRYEPSNSRVAAYFYIDGSYVDSNLNVYTAISPSAELYLGGYDSRHTQCNLHWAVVAANRNQSDSADMDDLMAAAAYLYPAGTFVPWRRSRLISMPAAGSSSLSAAGGSISTGTATPSVSYSLAAIGVAASGGSAGPSVALDLSAAGLVVSGGSASPYISDALAASGGSATGGAAGQTATVTIQAAGLAQTAGAAGLSPSVLIQAAGAALSSGNAELAVTALQAAAGSAQSSGNAIWAAQIAAAAAGTVTTSGLASLGGGPAGALDASGGSASGGSAGITLTVALSATGGSTIGGTATHTATVQITASGIVQAAGQGALVLHIDLDAFGAAQSSGAAVAVVSNSNYPLARLPSYLIVQESPVFMAVTQVPVFIIH